MVTSLTWELILSPGAHSLTSWDNPSPTEGCTVSFPHYFISRSNLIPSGENPLPTARLWMSHTHTHVTSWPRPSHRGHECCAARVCSNRCACTTSIEITLREDDAINSFTRETMQTLLRGSNYISRDAQDAEGWAQSFCSLPTLKTTFLHPSLWPVAVLYPANYPTRV